MSDKVLRLLAMTACHPCLLRNQSGILNWRGLVMMVTIFSSYCFGHFSFSLGAVTDTSIPTWWGSVITDQSQLNFIKRISKKLRIDGLTNASVQEVPASESPSPCSPPPPPPKPRVPTGNQWWNSRWFPGDFQVLLHIFFIFWHHILRLVLILVMIKKYVSIIPIVVLKSSLSYDTRNSHLYNISVSHWVHIKLFAIVNHFFRLIQGFFKVWCQIPGTSQNSRPFPGLPVKS